MFWASPRAGRKRARVQAAKIDDGADALRAARTMNQPQLTEVGFKMEYAEPDRSDVDTSSRPLRFRGRISWEQDLCGD